MPIPYLLPIIWWGPSSPTALLANTRHRARLLTSTCPGLEFFVQTDIILACSPRRPARSLGQDGSGLDSVELISVLLDNTSYCRCRA